MKSNRFIGWSIGLLLLSTGYTLSGQAGITKETIIQSLITAAPGAASPQISNDRPTTAYAWWDYRESVPYPIDRVNTLGWFCKVELRLEESTHIPIRFRLGSYQAAANLEGKGEASFKR